MFVEITFRRHFLDQIIMSMDSLVFARYADAEREFCETVGAILTKVIEDIEVKHGIAIAEIRVTMDRAGPDRWSRANCVLVREHENTTDNKTMGDRQLITPIEPSAVKEHSTRA